MTLNPVDYQIFGKLQLQERAAWGDGMVGVIMYRFKITRLLLLVLYNGIII